MRVQTRLESFILKEYLKKKGGYFAPWPSDIIDLRQGMEIKMVLKDDFVFPFPSIIDATVNEISSKSFKFEYFDEGGIRQRALVPIDQIELMKIKDFKR